MATNMAPTPICTCTSKSTRQCPTHGLTANQVYTRLTERELKSNARQGVVCANCDNAPTIKDAEGTHFCSGECARKYYGE